MVKELFELATNGDIERLRELFEDPESIFSTDPAQALNKRDKDGKSALDIAAMLGRKEIVRELLERGAEVNSQTKKGNLFSQGIYQPRKRAILVADVRPASQNPYPNYDQNLRFSLP